MTHKIGGTHFDRKFLGLSYQVLIHSRSAGLVSFYTMFTSQQTHAKHALEAS